MVELNKKYHIGVKKFGFVNWIGFKSLWFKECNRFMVVWQQTLLSPLVSSLLFLSVLSLALGNNRGDVLGYSFISFLAPGLIAMSILTQSFSHSVSSLMIGKIQGNIVDLLYAPLSPTEVTISVSLAAVTRSFMIATISIVIFYLIIDIQIKHFFTLILFTFLSSFILGNIGIVAGLWAEKFDHMASATNFIIVPLSFLSGTFYSINRLPDILKNVSEMNPFFYIIDGFRYGFIGYADSNLTAGLVVMTVFNIILFYAAYRMLKSGYKLKS